MCIKNIPTSYLWTYNLYGPMRTVIVLMRADPLRGQVGGDWALEIKTFLGHVKWHRAVRRMSFGDKKIPYCTAHVQFLPCSSSQWVTWRELCILYSLSLSVSNPFLTLQILPSWTCESWGWGFWWSVGRRCRESPHSCRIVWLLTTPSALCAANKTP